MIVITELPEKKLSIDNVQHLQLVSETVPHITLRLSETHGYFDIQIRPAGAGAQWYRIDQKTGELIVVDSSRDSNPDVDVQINMR